MTTPASPVHVEHGAAWFARRARNAARRVPQIVAAGSVGFLTTVFVLAIVPRQRQAEARIIASLLNQRLDTAALISRRDDARAAVAAADRALADARRHALRPPPPAVVDTFSPAAIALRDSLSRAHAVLTAMLERVQNAPLPATYRALGEIPALAGDARVVALLDSLAAIERARETFGSAGGVDPLFVALTARATEIGRSIQAVAEQRRDTVRAELLRLRPTPRPPPPIIPLVDTLPFVRRHAGATTALDSVERGLESARRWNTDIDQRVAATRTAANVVIPPLAMLAAGLIVGIGAGFGTALMLELRGARVADAEEAEAVTGARSLAVVSPRPRHAERSRRRVDREMSSLIEPGSDAYRLTYLHVAAAAPRVSVLAVTGEDPRVVATVGANIATAAAYDARTALLVDAHL